MSSGTNGYPINGFYCITKLIKKQLQNATQLITCPWNPSKSSSSESPSGVRRLLRLLLRLPPINNRAALQDYKKRFLPRLFPSASLSTFSCVPVAHVASTISSPAIVVILRCANKVVEVILELIRRLYVSVKAVLVT